MSDIAELRLPPGVKRPLQQRSQASMDRILDAAAALLAERGFREVSVAEIAERAGVSVGSFYSRFPDKESVLRTLEERMRHRGTRAVEVALGSARWDGRDLKTFLRTFVREVLSADQATQGLLRAFAVQSQVDPAYRPTYLEGRTNLLDVYRAAFVERVVERTSRRKAKRAALAFDMVIALSEQALLLAPTDASADEVADLLLASLA
jgi:AcrR family transcriptional regulator